MPAIMTHISPKTGKRMPCTAKVRACRFDGHELAVKPELQSFISEYTRPSSSHPAIQQAIDAKLSYQGPKPTWWAEYAATAETHPLLPLIPELLDVVDSPVGKLAVVWQEHSHRDQDSAMTFDSGIQVSRLVYRSMETGEMLGRLNIERGNDEAFDLSFGTDEFAMLRAHQHYSGERIGLDSLGHVRMIEEDRGVPQNSVNLQGEALKQQRRDVWLQFHKGERRGYTKANGEFISARDLSEEHLPDDETVRKDLCRVSREVGKQVRQRRAYSATPHAGFVEMEKPLRGQGFGTAMYVYGARYLGRRNQVMRGSDTQLGPGKVLWDNLHRYFPGQIGKIRLHHFNRTRTLPTLDFRGI